MTEPLIVFDRFTASLEDPLIELMLKCNQSFDAWLLAILVKLIQRFSEQLCIGVKLLERLGKLDCRKARLQQFYGCGLNLAS